MTATFQNSIFSRSVYSPLETKTHNRSNCANSIHWYFFNVSMILNTFATFFDRHFSFYVCKWNSVLSIHVTANLAMIGKYSKISKIMNFCKTLLVLSHFVHITPEIHFQLPFHFQNPMFDGLTDFFRLSNKRRQNSVKYHSRRHFSPDLEWKSLNSVCFLSIL